jgi:hypothetical protein
LWIEEAGQKPVGVRLDGRQFKPERVLFGDPEIVRTLRDGQTAFSLSQWAPGKLN